MGKATCHCYSGSHCSEESVKPSLLRHNKKVRANMFLKVACPVSRKGTVEGWSSEEPFLVWAGNMLVAEI